TWVAWVSSRSIDLPPGGRRGRGSRTEDQPITGPGYRGRASCFPATAGVPPPLTQLENKGVVRISADLDRNLVLNEEARRRPATTDQTCTSCTIAISVIVCSSQS